MMNDSVVDSAPVTSHSYQYDALNRRTQATLEDGSYWSYGYDDRDELTSAKRNWSYFATSTPVSGQQFSYAYDNIGNRQTASFGGDQSGTSLWPVSYTVNNLNQYTSIVTPGIKDILGAALATNSVTVNGGVADRHGEYFHRQISVANTNQPVWQNVTNVSGTFTNKGGSVFPANSQALVYDSDGNLSFDGVWSYQWDGENRLISMMMTNISSIANSNRLQLQFTYDYMGRRIQKIVSSWNGSGFVAQSTNRFVYDGWNLLAILNPQSSIIQTFMWGNDLSGNLQGAGGVGGLLTANLSGTNCFVTYDGNGNITALINAADKSLAARYEYSPYGELLRETELLAHQNPFRFSTKYEDEESGLVYYGHRYYAPVQGRWYGRDPNEESDGNTLYAFVGNSPINGTDTLGLFLTWGHNRMIDNVFGDLLSNDQRKLLKMGSRFVDKKYAGVEYSFMHAMTPKTWVKEMGKEEAQQKAQRMATGWVSECLYTAIDEAGGDKNYALFILGAGMHTIMDSMCPEHADFQVWGGFNGWSSLASVGHGYKEFFHSIPSYIDNLTGDTTDPLIGYYNMFDLLSN